MRKSAAPASPKQRGIHTVTAYFRQHGSRRVTIPLPKIQTHRQQNQLSSGRRLGHRGVARPLWGRGPREPPSPMFGYQSGGSWSLFIDGINGSISPGRLRQYFNKFGKIMDVFVSRKKCQSSRSQFGFVRFQNRAEAEDAIRAMDGRVVEGSKLLVSLARYNKEGQPFKANISGGGASVKTRRIEYPSLRDDREYREVVMGKKKAMQVLLHRQKYWSGPHTLRETING